VNHAVRVRHRSLFLFVFAFFCPFFPTGVKDLTSSTPPSQQTTDEADRAAHENPSPTKPHNARQHNQSRRQRQLRE
jgi:hypothetical protein